MAIKQLKPVEPMRGMDVCPRCKGKLLAIEGTFIKWLKCIDCKYTTLLEKDDFGKIKITDVK